MPLQIVRSDIAAMRADAIVSSANPRPVVDGGVDRAIHAQAGPELLAARRDIGDIAPGEAFLTPAFRLSAKYVIHTVSPIWRGGAHGEREILARCYANSLRLALERGCASVAFPLLSAGVSGCPAEIAIATATRAIRDFLTEHEMDVFLVVLDRGAFQISRSLFDDVQEYLDEMYLEEIEESLAEEKSGRLRRLFKDHMVLGDEAPDECAMGMVSAPMPTGGLGRKKTKPRRVSKKYAAPETARDLADLLDEADDTFSEALLRLIDAKGKTDPEIYKRANVNRKHFSKIRNNPGYQPSKTTALAFAIALELDLDETKDFIARAGYAISHSSKLDIIVEYFIERGEYDIFTINETLFKFEQPCLG